MKDDILEMFGLSSEQLEILYSIEHILTERDITNNPKTAALRRTWLNDWLKILDDSMYPKSDMNVFEENAIIDRIKSISDKSKTNTWFYLVMLETTVFRAYFPIDEDKDHTKSLSKLKYSRDTEYLKQLANASGIMDGNYIDRYIKTYDKMYRKLSGKSLKAVITGVSILAVTAIAAAVAAIFAGPIAVAIFGEGFQLAGAALTSACLAMAGGGAIAVGGLGMAGGVAAIAGGGALLGAAGSGAAAAVVSAFAKSSPETTVSQAAKLEVVLREVLLNAQQDTENAQLIIGRLQNQVKELQKELDTLKAEQEKDKKAIDNLKKSIEILKKAIKDMAVFKSSYETGFNEAS